MRVVLILMFVVWSIPSTSQELAFEYPVRWKRNSVELHSITNKKVACTFLLNPDSIKAFLTDEKEQTREIFTVKRKAGEKFLGGFIKDKKVHLFMNNGEDPGLHSWLYNLENNDIKENTFPFEIKKEKIIGRLSSETHFFYLTISKRKPEFVIYNFSDEKNYDTLRFTVGPELMDRINEKSFTIEHVGMEGECSVEIAANRVKSYISGDVFRIINNEMTFFTDIYEFDLNANQYHFRKISHQRHEPDFGETQADNTFLLDNRLYYFFATDKWLNVQVIDFLSGRILRHFEAKRDEEIRFRNTALMQKGGLIFDDETRELGKTSQLIRKVLNGSPAISATRDTLNRIQLLVGSYKKGSTPMGGFVYAFPVGASMYMTAGVFIVSNWQKTAHFKMLLNEQGDHIPGEISPSVNGKIEGYSTGIKISPGAENLISLNGSYRYLYYDKDKRTFNMVRF